MSPPPSRKRSVKSKSTIQTDELDSVPKSPLFLIYGDDDFLVSQEAKKAVEASKPVGGSELAVETIEGMATNQAEAEQVFRRLLEALHTPTFFSSDRVLWLRGTNLLGSSPTASASSVAEFWDEIHQMLKKGLPQGTALVISASEVDGRRGIVKTIQAMGKVIVFKSDPYKPEIDIAKAKAFILDYTSKLGLKIDGDAAERLVEMTDGDFRTLQSEMDKISTYLGDQTAIREEDVQAIGSWRPGGVAWDLPDAVGDRDLSKALNCLANLTFLGESPVALLFAVISRIRLLLLLRALADKKCIRLGSDYATFKSQLERLPSSIVESLPKDKKLNPLMGHPFVLWKSSKGAMKYDSNELHRSLQILLVCNEKMVTGGGDQTSLLQQALVEICMKEGVSGGVRS
jgi:DNA polymerase-3 subunit delta